MPKIKEIFKIGVDEPYVISFSTKINKFTLSIPEVALKSGNRWELSHKCFDTYQECVDEINIIHDTVMQEEIFTRKVIYITMQTNYDVSGERFTSNSQKGSQGFKWCWFVLDEFQVGKRLMYRVVESSPYANIDKKGKINILQQLMFSYNDGKIILLDYNELLLDKIKEVEDSLRVAIVKIQSFFNVDKEMFISNLLSITDTKLLGK